ncbi:MAG: nicotinate-nucleotide adenylyltransferase [Bacteroidales bacterium]|jgi:nicotinate-nucleotide adenylyltransferase|nr:nicotinate-nucleotide adenylyltransferase [Bacteroidales bacterium]
MDKITNVRKTGLYFGSFNPIHNGHLILAEHIVENSDLNQIWFVVSPQNPLKNQTTLLDNRSRFSLVQTAIEKNDKFFACDIEFHLPVPSYTINTLVYLAEKFPQRQFVLLIGEDNLVTFDKWKNYNVILEYYQLYVYPRKEIKENKESTENMNIHLSLNFLKNHPNVKMITAPQIEISSSFIRQNIIEGKSIRYLVPENVRDEIEKYGYYK